MDNVEEDLIGPAPKRAEHSHLRKVLLLACPPDPDTGQRTVRQLAKILGLTNEAVFKWIRIGRIPPVQAARIVDIADGRVTLSDFSAYYLLENLDQRDDA